MKKRSLLMPVIILLLLMAASVSAGAPAGDEIRVASVPAEITYQGRLTDAAGRPLSGNHNLRFELFDSESGPGKLWEQVMTGVNIQDGLVSVTLDVDHSDFWGQALWLAITVDGQPLSPRQALSPVPYALSLKPGALIDSDEYIGLNSVTSDSYGLRGESSSDSAGAGVLGENSGGVGDGVQGGSDGRAGVFGIGEGPDSFGGFFVGLGAGGVYALSESDAAPDIVLGANDEWNDDGTIASDHHYPGSDIKLYSNDAVVIDLDDNGDEDSALVIRNDADDMVVLIYEDGSAEFHGDLQVWGRMDTAGPTCITHDLAGAAYNTVIDVPYFCLDQMCQVYIFQDGVMGAFGPGLLWPVQYMQYTDDNSWIGGPNIALGGVGHSDGIGVNGNGVWDAVHGAGQTTGGDFVRVLDDSSQENSPDEWTIQFSTAAGELTHASVTICPAGVPVSF